MRPDSTVRDRVARRPVAFVARLPFDGIMQLDIVILQHQRICQSAVGRRQVMK